MSYLAMARRIIAASANETASASSAPLSAAPDPGPYGLGRCFLCGRELPIGVLIARCALCSGSVSPAPTRAAPPYPLRVVVEGDIPRAAVADLACLEVVAAAYSEIWHDDRQLAAATELGERIEMLLERIERAGCAVRVVELH